MGTVNREANLREIVVAMQSHVERLIEINAALKIALESNREISAQMKQAIREQISAGFATSDAALEKTQKLISVQRHLVPPDILATIESAHRNVGMLIGRLRTEASIGGTTTGTA